MLTIEEQLEIYKESKERYKIYFNQFHCSGMCWALVLTLKDKGCDADIYNIEEFLPTFTHDHITDLSKLKGFKAPKPTLVVDYWWPVPESKDRLSAFDALIKELEHGL